MKYKASVTILGKKYKGEGDSLISALGKIKPGFSKVKSVLTIEHGGKKHDKILGVIATSRLFSENPTIREVQTKQVATLFDL